MSDGRLTETITVDWIKNIGLKCKETNLNQSRNPKKNTKMNT